MPESKTRKKTGAVVAAPVKPKRKGPSPRWFSFSILAFLLLGVAYLVVYYASGGTAPGMTSLGAWNLLIGFGLIVVGFTMATQWR